MGAKAHQTATDSPKTEVGEIDTRAPFKSVKAAVSLFRDVASSVDKSLSSPRKPKPQPTEKPLANEKELHLAQKELNRYTEQLSNAETTRIQALAELDRARKTVDELTCELKSINNSTESARKVTEAAKGQINQLEAISITGGAKDSSWQRELDESRELYAVALTELDAAKQELRMMQKHFDASMGSKIAAFQEEAEAQRSSDANREKITRLAEEITAAKESLIHVKLAVGKSRDEESKICLDYNARIQSYRSALDETGKELATLKNEFDPELCENLAVKLMETSAEISTLESVATELDDAKLALKRIADEESSLKTLVESLEVELEAVKKERSEVEEKDSEIKSIIRISSEEFETLARKAEECERKTALAMAEVEALRASEGEVMERLEAVREEMEAMGVAMEEAVKITEMAEMAKKAVEGELRKWREREQRRVEGTRPPPVPMASERRATGPAKKPLLPSIFQRRKSQAERCGENHHAL